MYFVHQTPLSSWSRAVHKFFSLGVLTFATHYKQLCAMAMCYIFQIQMPKICFSIHLSTALWRVEWGSGYKTTQSVCKLTCKS